MFTTPTPTSQSPDRDRPPFPGFDPHLPQPPILTITPTAACHPRSATRVYLHNTFIRWPRWLIGAREVVIADPDPRTNHIRRSSLILTPIHSHPLTSNATEPSATGALSSAAAPSATAATDPHSAAISTHSSRHHSNSGSHSRLGTSSSGSSILSRLLPTFPFNIISAHNPAHVLASDPRQPSGAPAAAPPSAPGDDAAPAEARDAAVTLWDCKPRVLAAAGAAAVVLLVMAVVLPAVLLTRSAGAPALAATTCGGLRSVVSHFPPVPPQLDVMLAEVHDSAAPALQEWASPAGSAPALSARLQVVPLGERLAAEVRHGACTHAMRTRSRRPLHHDGA